MDNYKPRLEKLYNEKLRSNLKEQFKYKNAIPTSLGAINFEATTGDTDIVTYPITFRIDSFEILTV